MPQLVYNSTMTEITSSTDIREIGIDGFSRLVKVLQDREGKRYNDIGWGGTATELQKGINEGNLVPASAFAVVSEGMVRYTRKEKEVRSNTDSLRFLAKSLLEGAEVYHQASQVDMATLKKQIGAFVKSHGGNFDEGLNWEAFIKERATRLKKKADDTDAVLGGTVGRRF